MRIFLALVAMLIAAAVAAVFAGSSSLEPLDQDGGRALLPSSVAGRPADRAIGERNAGRGVLPQGRVASAARDAGIRHVAAGGAYSLQPWRIQCDEYRERDGMLIPPHAEVAWISGGRAEPYWRGRITSITYRYN